MIYGPSPVKRARRTQEQLAVLDEAIIAAVAQDAPVTVRGVYYRVVSAGVVDKTKPGYDAVERRLLVLRRSARVHYRDIVDGTRWITKPRTYTSIDDALRHAADSYRRNLWSTSVHHIELFIEKEAISGVILPITEGWDVALGVMRGYPSESLCWSVAETLDRSRVNVLAQLGDHDPSGVGAWDNFCAKVAAFASDAVVKFVRLAVTAEQITDMRLPTRPTKTSDTRAASWVGGSVDVDAIAAPVLRGIVNNWITDHVDANELSILLEAERSEREVLARIAGGRR